MNTTQRMVTSAVKRAPPHLGEDAESISQRTLRSHVLVGRCFRVPILLVVCWVLSMLGCRAQETIPLEEYEDYQDNEIEIPDGAYIKDINGLLDKYVGTWKGSHEGKNFEFIIWKNTVSFLDISMDELLMKYKITDSSGVIVADNTWVTSRGLLVKGAYLAKTKTYYVLDYYGFEGRCGQNGYVLIEVFGTNNDQMKFFLEVQGERAHDCTEAAEQVLPTESITLTKQ